MAINNNELKKRRKKLNNSRLAGAFGSSKFLRRFHTPIKKYKRKVTKV